MKNTLEPFADTLYLASASSTRQQLLKDAKINFIVINQNADEKLVDWNQPLTDLVAAIASLKMEHVIIPNHLEREAEILHVVTADTLTQSAEGKILGKPSNRKEAIEQIKLAASGSLVATGFCVEKKVYSDGVWITQARILETVVASCTVVIPEDFVAYYLDNSCAMSGCGSVIIDGIGLSFVKEIHGSYSTILGLPLFELRMALEKLRA